MSIYSTVQNYETTSIFDSFPDLKCNDIYTQILQADKLHIIGKEIFSGCHVWYYIWNLINIHGDNPIVMLFNPLIPLSLPNEVALFYQNNHLFRCQQLTRSEQKCQLRWFSSADVIIHQHCIFINIHWIMQFPLVFGGITLLIYLKDVNY